MPLRDGLEASIGCKCMRLRLEQYGCVLGCAIAALGIDAILPDYGRAAGPVSTAESHASDDTGVRRVQKPLDLSTMAQTGSSLSVNGKTFGVGLQGSQLKSVGSGLPSGVTVSGHDITVRQAGVTLEGYDLRGYCVAVQANNVTIKNNLFNATSFHTVFQGAASSGLVVEYNTFDGQKANNTNADLVFSESGAVTIRNNEFLNLPTDAVNVAGGTIEHNYFGGSGYQTGAHADAISIHRTAAPVTIRENYIDFIDRADAQTGTNAAIKIVSHFGAIDHVTVDSNVLLGGGYTIYTGSAGNPVSNVTFINNDIGLGKFGPLMGGDHGSDFVFQRNRNVATGTPIPDYRPPRTASQPRLPVPH